LTGPGGFNVMNPNNPIPQSTSKSAGARLEYRNPLNNLFFNVGSRLSDTKNNLLASSAVNDLGFSVIEYIESENKRTSTSYYAEIGKYFPKFKTNASVTFNDTTSKSQSRRNNEDINNKPTELYLMNWEKLRTTVTTSMYSFILKKITRLVFTGIKSIPI